MYRKYKNQSCFLKNIAERAGSICGRHSLEKREKTANRVLFVWSTIGGTELKRSRRRGRSELRPDAGALFSIPSRWRAKGKCL